MILLKLIAMTGIINKTEVIESVVSKSNSSLILAAAFGMGAVFLIGEALE